MDNSNQDSSWSYSQQPENNESTQQPNGPPEINQGDNLYVKGISNTTSEVDLNDLFSQFGKVTSCRILMDPTTRESRGFGFVTMENVQGADAAIENLQNFEFNGKSLYIEKAKRGRARSPTPGTYKGHVSDFKPRPRYDDRRRYDDRGDRHRHNDNYRDERRYDDYPSRRHDSRDERPRYDDRPPRRNDDRDERPRYNDNYRDERRYDDNSREPHRDSSRGYRDSGRSSGRDYQRDSGRDYQRDSGRDYQRDSGRDSQYENRR